MGAECCADLSPGRAKLLFQFATDLQLIRQPARETSGEMGAFGVRSALSGHLIEHIVARAKAPANFGWVQ